MFGGLCFTVFLRKSLKIRSEKMLKNLLLLAEKGITTETWVGCIIGITVVFAGLICIIGLIELSNLIISKIEGAKKSANQETATPVAQAPAAPVASGPIENREELVAAICAAVAEENGTDISAIRVVSFKKI